MNPTTVRSVHTESYLDLTRCDFALSQWRYFIRKLLLKRSEHIHIVGTPPKGLLDLLTAGIGPMGKINLQLADEPNDLVKQALHNELTEVPQASILIPGPSTESQQCNTVVLLPQVLVEPYDVVLTQAWNRLHSGGRILLTLPSGEGERLDQAVQQAMKLGFVTRFRRNCDEHCVWIGVKYAN